MSRLILMSVCCWAAVSQAQDAGVPDAGGLPVGWFVGGKTPNAYQVESLPKGTCGAGPTAQVRSKGPGPGNVTVMQVFRADNYRGMRVRLTAKVTVSDVTGWVGLWMRVEGPKRKTLAYDNMQARPLRGSVPCGTQTVVLDVDHNAELMALGLILEGPGSAQLSNVDLEAVDDSVLTTDLVKGFQDPRGDNAIGRVGSVWFTDRIVNRQDTNMQLKLVAPGKWRDGSGDYTAEVQGDEVLATALDLTQNTPLALSGSFRFRKEKDVTIIEGSWGTTLTKHPVSIRYSRKAMDLKWGFYERHLVVERAPQLAEHCVYYAQWASPTRLSDELQVCGVVYDVDAARVQTLLAFLYNGFRRFGTGIPLDEPQTAPVWPGNQLRE